MFREKEAEALQLLDSLLAPKGLHVRPCGLFVDTEAGYLAASPDGVLDEDTLVEVKCPLKCRDRAIADLAASDSSFCLGLDPDTGTLALKRSHNYYYQVQGQLHCAGRTRCVFMVWAPTEHHLETVHYDPEFWAEMEESLRRFYLDCLLPEIVDPRAPRGRKVREPRA